MLVAAVLLGYSAPGNIGFLVLQECLVVRHQSLVAPPFELFTHDRCEWLLLHVVVFAGVVT